MKQIVKELVASDGTRKVQIFQRDDPLERCWIPHGRYSECFAPSAEAAEFEARGRVD